jgi:hypothetical protein
MQCVTLCRTCSRWQGEQHVANQYKIVLDQQRGDFMKDIDRRTKREGRTSEIITEKMNE